jgi:uncharacterized alpha/beta hydrolase family protein
MISEIFIGIIIIIVIVIVIGLVISGFISNPNPHLDQD